VSEKIGIDAKYQNAKPISPQVVTAWEAWVWNRGGWEHRVALWHKDATIFDVHAFYLARFMAFYLRGLDVGEVIVERVDHFWSPDARWVDQEWNITLRPSVGENIAAEAVECPDYL
jgi:hypothetical protein